MIISIILIIISFFVLVKSSDIFVDNAVILARKLKINKVVIGATIISAGTALPELLVSSFSALQGSSEMAFSNGFGSIIFNAGIIASIVLLFGNISISDKQKNSLNTPLSIFYIANFLIIIFIIFKWPFVRLFSFAFICLYIYYANEVIQTGGNDEETETTVEETKSTISIIMFLIICAILLAVSSRLLVNNAVFIARSFNISETVIGMTILAIGTSLPELVTAITCIRKNQGAISFGNIIGANLIDATLVTGVPAFIQPYVLTEWGMAATSMIIMGLIGLAIYHNFNKKVIAVLCILVYFSFIILRTVGVL